MDDKETVIKSDDLGMKLCKLLGISPKNVRRMTFDLPAGEPMLITIERWGTKDLLSFKDWSDLKGARVEEIEVSP